MIIYDNLINKHFKNSNINNYAYSNPFYRGFYPNILSALPVPLSNSFINIADMPLTQQFSPAFHQFHFLLPYSQVPQHIIIPLLQMNSNSQKQKQI